MGNISATSVVKLFDEGKIEKAKNALHISNYKEVANIAIDRNDSKLLQFACTVPKYITQEIDLVFAELFYEAIQQGNDKRKKFYLQQANAKQKREVATLAFIDKDCQNLDYILANGAYLDHSIYPNEITTYKMFAAGRTPVDEQISYLSKKIELAKVLVKYKYIDNEQLALLAIMAVTPNRLNILASYDFDPHCLGNQLFLIAAKNHDIRVLNILLEKGFQLTKAILDQVYAIDISTAEDLKKYISPKEA